VRSESTDDRGLLAAGEFAPAASLVLLLMVYCLAISLPAALPVFHRSSPFDTSKSSRPSWIERFFFSEMVWFMREIEKNPKKSQKS
jgi:hypothetical protein